LKDIDYKTLKIEPSNILFASTSDPDYEMNRIILLEDGYDEFVVVEGGHCSCYGFDETEWYATGYTGEELKKLANLRCENDMFWKMVKKYLDNN